MRKILFAAALSVAGTVCAPNDASALGRKFKSAAVTTTCTATTATEKSTVQARTGRMEHVGRLLPGLREGVGFSTVSAADALSRCCYSNSGLPVVEQAVVKGERGWFATKLFGKATCAGGICK